MVEIHHITPLTFLVLDMKVSPTLKLFFHCVQDCRDFKNLWSMLGFTNLDFFAIHDVKNWLISRRKKAKYNKYGNVLAQLILTNLTWVFSRLIVY